MMALMLRRRRRQRQAKGLARILVALDDAARERGTSLPRRSRLSLGAVR
jgi:hypothetical protein